MSVIQRIQNNQKWVFGILALALILFVVQDALYRKGSIFSNTTTIGKVNGDKIEKSDFDDQVDFALQMQGQQGQNVTREQLMPNVWTYMVDNTVMNQEYNKLGLTVTSKELGDILFGANPPQWVQQAFADPNTGKFDVNVAKQQFNQIKKRANEQQAAFLSRYIKLTQDQALRQKYQSLVAGAAYIPKWMAEKTTADENAIAKISYVAVPYASVNDSAVKVSDDEIMAYVKDHAKQFQQKEASRYISYVTFDAKASSADSASVFNQLSNLKAQFAATNNEKSFLAANGSDLPYYASFISKNDIRQTVKDSLFKLSAGQIYGPYVDGNSFVIAKMVAERQMPDSVKVRHILVATRQQTQDGQMVRTMEDSSAKKRLDSAIAELNSGKSWDSVALKYSDDPGSKNKAGVYDFFASGRMVETFNDFAFSGNVGEKKVVETPYGYHYVEILAQKGSDPGYKIAYISKPIVVSQETDDAAKNAAGQFAGTSRNYQQFVDNAGKANKQIGTTQEIKENDFAVGSLGDNRQFVRWIYDNKTGNVSDVYSFGDKYVVGVITAVNDAGLPSVQTARPLVEMLVKNEKKAQVIINTKIKGNSLEDVAQNAGTSVQSADSVSFSSMIIPNLGNEIKVVGAAFNQSIQGKMSTPIAGQTAVILVKGEGVSAKASLGLNPEEARKTAENNLRQQISYRSLNALREAAKVKDQRSTFY
jgi:peptidyl-prolyl cis-trans isomerase D